MQREIKKTQHPALSDRAFWTWFAVILFALHVPYLNRYGYFRDELYYLSCSRHLAWGYVDHPPFSIFLLAAVRSVLGDSLFAVRFPAIVAISSTVWLTGWLTREIGGGRFAQALAMIGIISAPIYLAVTHFYSMNALDIFFWTAGICTVFCALKSTLVRDWLICGVVLGIGVLNKWSVLWLIAGLAAALLLTAHRRALLKIGPWLAFTVVVIIQAPHIWWQTAHGWPTLEFMHNATTVKMLDVPPLQFISTQILAMNPANAPLWIGGLFWCLLSQKAGKTRILGITFVTVVAILIINGKSRANYLSPAFPGLFAAGAFAFEQITMRKKIAWQRAVAITAPAIVTVIMLPMVLPILPTSRLQGYLTMLKFTPPQEEAGQTSPFPQHFADMFGWEELAIAVGEIYHRLTPDEQARCAIYTNNYGEAGAIDHFGPGLGLPPAICHQNNYWIWGPGKWDGSIAIIVNLMDDQTKNQFEHIDLVRTLSSPFVMPEERDTPIYVARQLKGSVADYWKLVKHYQ